MKLLLDNGLPRMAATLFSQAGHPANHVGDLGLSQAGDYEILKHAFLEGSVIVTLDADFHTMLALSGAQKPSVIRLRIEGLKAADVVRIVVPIAVRFEKELDAGAVISVGRHTARCHVLRPPT